jgi:chromosome transmission fidelity protein 8
LHAITGVAMPSITLDAKPIVQSPHSQKVTTADASAALPTLLQTPSGLAILEIQGTIHAPFPSPAEDASDTTHSTQTAVGRLEFPLYDKATPDDTKWMKKVYLYVGHHQRLVGEVKKLAKPLGVVQKRGGAAEPDKSNTDRRHNDEDTEQESLEISEVIKWKIMFQGRPEPV